MLQIKSFAFVGYPVTDLLRALAFYEGVLGLPRGESYEVSPGIGWYEYDIAGQTLAITNMAPDWKPSNQGATLALEVEDLDAAYSHMKDHNVRIAMEVTESPVCRFFVVSDPDANQITLHKLNA